MRPAHKSLPSKTFALLAALGIGLTPVLPSAAAEGGDFPNRAVRVIVPSPPGGGTDTVTRIISDKLAKLWGQPVVIENRSGGGGNISAEVVAHAPADGYTLMSSHPAPLVVNQTLYRRLTYVPEDFVPVSLTALLPNVLVVAPDFPARSVPELIDLARARPDKINYASGVVGSLSYMTPALLKLMTGIQLVGVPYQGSAPALTAVVAGQVDLMFVELSPALPFIRSGKVRALALASAQPTTLLPGTPAVAESLPGFDAPVWYGVVAPPGTPAPIARKLSDAIAEVLKMPDVQRQMKDLSMEPVGGTPAEMARFMARERDRWARVIRATGEYMD